MNHAAFFVGVDVGGTSIRAALLRAEDATPLTARQIPTLAREGHEAVLARLAALVQTLIAENALPPREIGGVGVGLPGKLDPQRGVVEFLPNLEGHWQGVRAAEILSERLALPVYLLNDARAMTLGEWAYGAGRGCDTVACFTLGTGIGGGVVVNGQLQLGHNGAVGELGHQIVELNGPLCGCGGRGCLEVYASGPAIAAQGVRAVMQGLTTAISAAAGHDLNRITPAVIAEAAQQGDRVAQEIFQRAGAYLGIGVANVIVALGPQRIILGGGLAQVGAVLFEPVRRTVAERVHLVPTAGIEIVPAQLGPHAGLIGAAHWAALRSQKSGSNANCID